MYEVTLISAPFVALAGYGMYYIGRLKGLGVALTAGAASALMQNASDVLNGQPISPTLERLLPTAVLLGSVVVGAIVAKVRPPFRFSVQQATLDDFAEKA